MEEQNMDVPFWRCPLNIILCERVEQLEKRIQEVRDGMQEVRDGIQELNKRKRKCVG